MIVHSKAPIGKKPKKKKPRRRIKTVGDNRKKEADTLWSLLIKHLGGHVCALCGKATNLNSHHLNLKPNFRLRYSITNGMCLCGYCHKFKAHSQFHVDKTDFGEWVKKVRGADIWGRLEMLRRDGTKSDLGLNIIRLRQELKKMEEKRTPLDFPEPDFSRGNPVDPRENK